MALEDAINRLADAINNLAKVPNIASPALEEAPRPLISGIDTSGAPKRGPGRPPSENKQPPTPTPTAPVPPAPEQAAAAAPKTTGAEEAAKSVYAELQRVTNELAADAPGRKMAVEVFTALGTANARDLKPEQWADAILRMKAKLAEKNAAQDPLA